MGADGMRAVTHMVIVRPVRRTPKLCAAISSVPYIVTDDWIKACESAKAFVAAEP